MAEIIKGAPVAQEIRERLTREVEQLQSASVTPVLAVVLVGDDPGSVWYARSKTKVGAKVGVEVRLQELPADTAEDELVDRIQRLNADAGVHGILVELPLPRAMDKARVLNTIAPHKDVDGVTAVNRGYLLGGQEERALIPATPQSCIELLEHAGVNLRGTRVTLVGRGDTVGRPLAMLCIKRDATLTVCHTKTVDLAAECRRAEVLIAAAGSPGLITAEMVSPGTVVIDAGINETEDGFVGDVDFDAVSKVAKAITPVPGGVGSLTTTIIMSNTIRAARGSLGSEE